MGNTLKELANHYAQTQKKQVDSLTEKAPILDMIPFDEASHGLWNVYEELKDVTGAAFVNMNAPLGKVDAVTDLRKIDLNIMGGEMEVPEDTAKMFGGKEKYFAKKLPAILKKSGMAAEYKILYDNFRAAAIAKGKYVKVGGNANANYSIIAVRFEEEVCTGLLSPEGFGKGAVLDAMPLNGGTLYRDSKGVLVYGMRLKSYMGIQIASDRNVAALVNITASNVPTAAQIDDLLADVRADGSTYLFMHQKTKNFLNKYKSGGGGGTAGEGALQTFVDTKNLDRTFDAWNGVKIVTSYNFLEGTEANVA